MLQDADCAYVNKAELEAKVESFIQQINCLRSLYKVVTAFPFPLLFSSTPCLFRGSVQLGSHNPSLTITEIFGVLCIHQLIAPDFKGVTPALHRQDPKEFVST